VAAVPDISGTADRPLQVTDITLTSAVADTSDIAAEAETAITDKIISDATAMPKEDAAEPDVKTAALDQIFIPEIKTADPAAPKSLCESTMTATPNVAAMVDISLSANCYPNERVTFHHNGMMFTDATDTDGKLDISIPALSENAVFIVAFANGEGALANAKVPTLASFDRMVVQSKAKSKLHINAFEFGAEFSDAGHVSAESGRKIEDATNGIGGFITSLGDTSQGEALVAEVYTFPTSTSKMQGDVVVSVDAEVTIANCGLRVEAQTLEVRMGQQMKVQDLSLPIPSCGAVGDFLVLQNLLQDLKVASN
jgi:hypothetical protein